MRLRGRSIISADPLDQLFGGEQAILLDDIALAVVPLGFNRIEPGTFCGQIQGQDTHAFLSFLDLDIMLTNPGAYDLAIMPRSVIPNQQPCSLAPFLQLYTAPLQKLGSNVTNWSSHH